MVQKDSDEFTTSQEESTSLKQSDTNSEDVINPAANSVSTPVTEVEQDESDKKFNEPTDFTLKIKLQDGVIHDVTFDSESSVEALKDTLATTINIPKTEQRLVHAGRILQDARTIKSYDIKSNDIVFAIKIANSTCNASTRGASTSVSGFPADIENDMSRMLNSPMMKTLFEHTDFFRYILDTNPRLREIREKCPELGHMLNDPEFLDAIRNPMKMKEMVQNADRAMSNIESMPGGFNALRRMYQTTQKLMSGSDFDIGHFESSTPVTNPEKYSLGNNSPPNKEPLPNPWAIQDHNYGAGKSQLNIPGPSSASMTIPGSVPSQNQQVQASLLNHLASAFAELSTAQTSSSQPLNTASLPQTGAQSATPRHEDQTTGTQASPDFETLFQNQLVTMREMGFTDNQACIEALRHSGGNVEGAVEQLLENATREGNGSV